MNQDRFAELTRHVSSTATRRAALRALVAGLVAPPVAWGSLQTAEAGVPIVHCKIPGQHCNKDNNCCSQKCKRGICTCREKGAPCWNPLEGSFCCSGRCRDGRCK